MKETDIRALQALDLRNNERWTLRRLGELYGVSKERARQLVLRGERVRSTQGQPKSELTARVRNALAADGCEPTPDAVAARYTVKEMRGILNVGPKSVGELQAWLIRHGQQPRCE